MHAQIDGGGIKLLTRTGLAWSHRYWRTMEALGLLEVKLAELDGELCGLYGDVPVVSPLQAAFRSADHCGRTLASASIMAAVVRHGSPPSLLERLECHLSAFRAT